jgi:hypothetical protein
MLILVSYDPLSKRGSRPLPVPLHHLIHLCLFLQAGVSVLLTTWTPPVLAMVLSHMIAYSVLQLAVTSNCLLLNELPLIGNATLQDMVTSKSALLYMTISAREFTQHRWQCIDVIFQRAFFNHHLSPPQNSPILPLRLSDAASLSQTPATIWI